MATKKEQGIKLIDKENFGEALHAALRKCCDSTPTSIAYNVIHEMGHEWSDYVNFLANRIGDPKDEKGLVAKVKEISLLDPWGKETWVVTKGRTCLPLILSLTFELFSARDWDGYCSFLMEE